MEWSHDIEQFINQVLGPELCRKSILDTPLCLVELMVGVILVLSLVYSPDRSAKRTYFNGPPHL
jgi:hypothetical protein